MTKKNCYNQEKSHFHYVYVFHNRLSNINTNSVSNLFSWGPWLMRAVCGCLPLPNAQAPVKSRFFLNNDLTFSFLTYCETIWLFDACTTLLRRAKRTHSPQMNSIQFPVQQEALSEIKQGLSNITQTPNAFGSELKVRSSQETRFKTENQNNYLLSQFLLIMSK